MEVFGGAPVTNVQRPDETALVLRINQRIVAEILQISGDNITLALDGAQVVARLTSPEQALILAKRKFANFIVREQSGNTLVLELINPKAETLPPSTQQGDFVSNLLQHTGLAVNPENEIIARALIDQGLPVTPELVKDLSELLKGLGSWGRNEAQIASALKASGLPLSPEVLKLFFQQVKPILENLRQLQTLLQALPDEHLPKHLQGLVKDALNLLSSFQVDWSASPNSLQEQIKSLFLLFGRSLESQMAELLEGGNDLSEIFRQGSSDKGLLNLAVLRREVANDGRFSQLTGALDRFMEGLRLTQFLNSGAKSLGAKDQWLSFNLPLANDQVQEGKNLNQQGFMSARLRVAYQGEGEKKRIDLNHTRIVVLVDLEGGNVFEVDLSIAAKQIGAHVTATNQELRDRAEKEMPSLESSLDKIGFSLKTVRYEVGKPEKEPEADISSVWDKSSEINIRA